MDAASALALGAAREICTPVATAKKLQIKGESYIYHKNPETGRLEACVAWPWDGMVWLCCETPQARAAALISLGLADHRLKLVKRVHRGEARRAKR
jgi:hypothetical protein